MNKLELRKKYLKKRKSLTIDVWREKSDLLCQHLRSTEIFHNAKTILAYFSINQEPDLNSLFFLNKNWGFPYCVANQLQWHSWQWGESLEVGQYGIQQPLKTAPLIKVEEIDLILVPAIACDYCGYRLGYGGGYYDRLFCQDQWRSIPKIGIIFDYAYLPQLPRDPWDQKLQGVSTESGFLKVINNQE